MADGNGLDNLILIKEKINYFVDLTIHLQRQHSFLRAVRRDIYGFIAIKIKENKVSDINCLLYSLEVAKQHFINAQCIENDEIPNFLKSFDELIHLDKKHDGFFKHYFLIRLKDRQNNTEYAEAFLAKAKCILPVNYSRDCKEFIAIADQVKAPASRSLKLSKIGWKQLSCLSENELSKLLALPTKDLKKLTALAEKNKSSTEQILNKISHIIDSTLNQCTLDKTSIDVYKEKVLLCSSSFLLTKPTIDTKNTYRNNLKNAENDLIKANEGNLNSENSIVEFKSILTLLSNFILTLAEDAGVITRSEKNEALLFFGATGKNQILNNLQQEVQYRTLNRT